MFLSPIVGSESAESSYWKCMNLEQQCWMYVTASACAQVGLLSFPPRENELNKPYSDATALLIDQEVGAACLPFAVDALASMCDGVQLVECPPSAVLVISCCSVQYICSCLRPHA